VLVGLLFGRGVGVAKGVGDGTIVASPVIGPMVGVTVVDDTVGVTSLEVGVGVLNRSITEVVG
jgi:hypothetical protein